MSLKNETYRFKMWTEFNTKKISNLLYSRFLRKCMEGINLTPALPIAGEVVVQNSIITTPLRKDSVDIAIYNIVLYLGVYCFLEIDFYDKFVDGELFPDIFKQSLDPEISNLFYSLKQGNKSAMYYNEFDKLIRVLKGKIVMIEHDGEILSY